MSKKDNSIDKMAQQFTSLEEMQAYSEAQYKTILSLNEKINQQQKDIESLKSVNARLSQEITMNKASTGVVDNKYAVSDEETICVIQLAILKTLALERELVTDEVKRVEILVKTLGLIRGKVEQKSPGEKEAGKMSTEELIKWMETSSKDPQ